MILTIKNIIIKKITNNNIKQNLDKHKASYHKQNTPKEQQNSPKKQQNSLREQNQFSQVMEKTAKELK